MFPKARPLSVSKSVTILVKQPSLESFTALVSNDRRRRSLHLEFYETRMAGWAKGEKCFVDFFWMTKCFLATRVLKFAGAVKPRLATGQM